MSDGKNETPVQKADVTGDVTAVGKYRFQSYDKDKIHIHDDDNQLVFVKSKRAFQLGMASFLETYQHKIKKGKVAIVYGEEGGSSGGKNADLVLRRNKKGWTMELIDRKKATEADVVICDPVITELDEFVQRS